MSAYMFTYRDIYTYRALELHGVTRETRRVCVNVSICEHIRRHTYAYTYLFMYSMLIYTRIQIFLQNTHIRIHIYICIYICSFVHLDGNCFGL